MSRQFKLYTLQNKFFIQKHLMSFFYFQAKYFLLMKAKIFKFNH